MQYLIILCRFGIWSFCQRSLSRCNRYGSFGVDTRRQRLANSRKRIWAAQKGRLQYQIFINVELGENAADCRKRKRQCKSIARAGIRFHGWSRKQISLAQVFCAGVDVAHCERFVCRSRRQNKQCCRCRLRNVAILAFGGFHWCFCCDFYSRRCSCCFARNWPKISLWLSLLAVRHQVDFETVDFVAFNFRRCWFFERFCWNWRGNASRTFVVGNGSIASR